MQRWIGSRLPSTSPSDFSIAFITLHNIGSALRCRCQDVLARFSKAWDKKNQRFTSKTERLAMKKTPWEQFGKSPEK